MSLWKRLEVQEMLRRMTEKRAHAWNVTPREARAIQNRLSRYVSRRWDKSKRVKRIAGVDLSTQKRKARAAVVVMTYPDLVPMEQKTAVLPLSFPYIPGLLSFRECPALCEAFHKIENKPDLILVDGQGIAHPRRLGIASHLGVLLDIPTLGCAKSRLCGTHDEPHGSAGSYELLSDKEEVIGAALRTRNNTKVVYVSVGHRIDLKRAIEYTLSSCSGFRLPEPIRMAHRAAGGGNVIKKA
jgi:deoxyribonuclease V